MLRILKKSINTITLWKSQTISWSIAIKNCRLRSKDWISRLISTNSPTTRIRIYDIRNLDLVRLRMTPLLAWVISIRITRLMPHRLSRHSIFFLSLQLFDKLAVFDTNFLILKNKF